MSVCFSARISQKPPDQIAPTVFPVAMARSSSDDNAIRYVLPVLWMTSCYQTTEPMGQNRGRRVCFVEFARWRHQSDARQRHARRCCDSGAVRILNYTYLLTYPCHPEPHCGQHVVAICMCHEHVECSETERLPLRPHACGISQGFTQLKGPYF